MIIYRQKEFASTKESRKKSKEVNKKDKTRKALTIGQGVGVGLGAAGLYTGNKLSKKSDEKYLQAGREAHNILAGEIIPGVNDPSKRRREAEKLSRAGDRLTKAGKVALGAGLGLGAVKIARDIKKKKKKEIVLDSKPPKKMKGKESRSDLLKLNK